MTTPRKSYEALESPYAKHISQYPSQSEGFLPLELGGPGPNSYQFDHSRHTPNRNYQYTSTPAKSGHQSGVGSGRGGNRFTPSGGAKFYQNRHQNRGGRSSRYYGGEGGRSSDADSSFSGNGGINQGGSPLYNQHTPQRWSSRGSRGNRGSGQHNFKNSKGDEMASYFHSSMLEDPWRELMERHNAIRNSRINISTQQDLHNEEQNETQNSGSPGSSTNDEAELPEEQSAAGSTKNTSSSHF